MFMPLHRTAKTAHRPAAGFAETQFLHDADDDDYSGFAPTQLFDEDQLADAAEPMAHVEPAGAVHPASPADAHAAASTSRTALERAAAASLPETAAVPDEPLIPQSWVTSQWVAAQEAKAHEAANQARAVIAAQRPAEEHVEAAAPVAEPLLPRTGLARLRAAFEKLLPGEFRSLLPLFIGVTVTMALISAVLPMIDKP
jgi:hypothetical protein